MTVAAGTRLGPYEIVSSLGAGGMGEVYLARDSKLNRDVALKVLLPDVADNPERLARFRREAQILASLNHPNIGHIYGLEESGGAVALVLELVDGSTLADRITAGPIPFEEALPIARQIADALEAAHEQGIIHRDLKPANIKVRDDGTVKVLDFGLAKAMDAAGQAGQAGGAGRAGGAGMAALSSPTITSPALMTGVGMLLGTAAYMSPEQARGRPADKRSDIWAFGVVLYEMLCGERLFKGDDVAETLAAVLRLDVNWSALPAATPTPVRSLLERCLNRDTKRRLRDIGEARIVLAEPTSPAFGAEQPAAMRRMRPMWQRSLATVVSGVLIGIISGAAVWWATRATAPGVVRFSLISTGLDDVAQTVDRTFAITPDGATVVYAADNGTRLLARALNRLEPRVVASGVGLRGVAVSPDGLWVAFVDGSSVLKKVAITGGPSVTLTAMGSGSRGVAWVADDAVVFATNSTASGLQRVSAAGGEPVVLTTADAARGEGDHRWPEMLPGGESLLFTIVSPNERPEDSQAAILNVHTGTWEVVLRGADRAQYVPTGHLVYGVSGTLYAVPFDLGRRAVTGAAAPVLQGVMSTAVGSANVAFASNGSLVYIAGTAKGGSHQTVASIDRGGHGAPLEGLPPDSYRDVRLSPDGSQLALATQDDVFVYDFRRRTRTRLTTDPAPDRSPLWTPDNLRIVFTSRRAGGSPELFWRLADGSGDDQLLYSAPKDSTDVRANGWSSDGDLLFTEVSGAAGSIRRAKLGDFSNARLLVTADSPSPVSPHGGWMAYQSPLSGSLEVYVERYPELGDRKLISRGGGVRPVWSADGRELFYTNGRQMIVVPIEYGATLVDGSPRVLFDVPVLATAGNRPYEVTGDGNFLIIVGTEADVSTAPLQMIVVQNWFDELKRLVPTK